MKNKKSKPGIKNFFVYHIEKIVMAGAVVLLLWLFVSSLSGYTPLSWQPSDLSSAADQADQKIMTSTYGPKDMDPPLVFIPYADKAKWIDQDVSLDPFRTLTKWEPTLFPEKVQRGVPKVFGLTALRAVAGNGAVMTINRDRRATGGGAGAMGANSYGSETSSSGTSGGAASGTLFEGKRWIVVTGLIPIKEQLDEYINAFADATYTDPSIDTPRYLAYKLERCEYDPTPGAQQVWKEIDAVNALDTESRNWAGYGGEQVDHSYLVPMTQGMPMAYPLPPLAKKLFGQEIAYPPQVPLLSDSLVDDITKQDEYIKKQQEHKPVKLDDILKNPGVMNSPGGMDGGSTMGGPSMGGGYPGMSGASMGGTTTGMGGTSMGGTPGMGGGSYFANRQQQQMQYVAPVLVPNYLFRYFDFDIEEGKSYQYRVQLYLLNPNYRLDPKFLQDETMSKQTYLAAEFSAPSEPTEAGRLTRILAVDVNGPQQKAPWRRPTTSIRPIYFEMEDANEWASDDRTLNRGEIANFPRTSCFNPDLQRTSAMSGGPSSSSSTTSTRPGAGGPKKGQAASKSFDMISDVCIVDMYGGYQVEGGAKSPGKVLVMEPNGTLRTHDIGKDFDEVQKYVRPTAKTPGVSGGTMY